MQKSFQFPRINDREERVRFPLTARLAFAESCEGLGEEFLVGYTITNID